MKLALSGIYTRWVCETHEWVSKSSMVGFMCFIYKQQAQKSAKKEIHHLRLLCLHCATVFASITFGYMQFHRYILIIGNLHVLPVFTSFV